MLDYRVHIDKASMFNTPPVFAVYTSLLNLQWLSSNGGIKSIEKINKVKAQTIYSEIDSNPLFDGFANKEDRSMMNATFTLNEPKLKETFDSMALEAGLSGINGHRSVGGYRASMYNALPLESVKVLVDVMKNLEKSLVMNILANDGISSSGKTLLESKGFSVNIVNVAQEQLINFINDKNIEVLLVRSATEVRKELIDNCKNLKLIGRGGVGMDNIDVDYAKQKGLKVINTPAASSNSVAEIVFAHLFGSVRFLYDSNRNMPLDGDVNFKKLKKIMHQDLNSGGKHLGLLVLVELGKQQQELLWV